MNVSFIQQVLALSAGIIIIVLLTAKYHVHAFFALVIACFIMGLGVQISLPVLLDTMKEGFGNIMRSLGLVIVFGTTLGVLLENTGSTRTMASYILKLTGEKNASLAISITGFIVGLPVFSISDRVSCAPALGGLPRVPAPQGSRTGVSGRARYAAGMHRSGPKFRPGLPPRGAGNRSDQQNSL